MRYFFCIVGSLIGGFVTLILAVTLYMGVRETASVTKEPQRMELRQAVELAKSGRSAWVWLTDAQADCSRSATYPSTVNSETRDTASFIARNEARDIEIVMDVHDLRDCQYAGNVHYIGMLKKMDDEQRKTFEARGLRLPATGEKAWWLCGHCRPGDERSAVVIVLLLLILSGWLTVKVFRARSGRHAPPVAAD